MQQKILSFTDDQELQLANLDKSLRLLDHQ